jgi:hypothetical protein
MNRSSRDVAARFDRARADQHVSGSGSGGHRLRMPYSLSHLDVVARSFTVIAGNSNCEPPASSCCRHTPSCHRCPPAHLRRSPAHLTSHPLPRASSFCGSRPGFTAEPPHSRGGRRVNDGMPPRRRDGMERSWGGRDGPAPSPRLSGAVEIDRRTRRSRPELTRSTGVVIRDGQQPDVAPTRSAWAPPGRVAG